MSEPNTNANASENKSNTNESTKQDFTKKFKPPALKDMSKEDRELYIKQLKMDGELPTSQLSKEDLELINASTAESNAISSGSGGTIGMMQVGIPKGQQFFQEKAADSLAYWAQYTHYNIEMDDGTYLKVYRVKAPKYALEEMKSLNAEVTGGIDMLSDKVLSPKEIRIKEIQLETLKFSTYLRHVGTNEPVKRDEILHAADSTVPDGITEACLAISLSKWTETKK